MSQKGQQGQHASKNVGSERAELGPQQSIYWTMFSRIIWWNVGCWIPKCSQGTQSDEANSSLLGRYSRAMTWPSQLSNKNHAKNCLRQREKVGSVSHARHSQLRKFCAGQSAGDVHWSSLIIIDHHWSIDSLIHWLWCDSISADSYKL